MAKKIVLVDTSLRAGGNSETIVDILAKELSDEMLTVFKLREKRWNPCYGCNTCFNKGVITCAHDDDVTRLLPKLEEADGIVVAGPIYFGSLSGPSKSFIDRFYAFFNPAKGGMSKTAKPDKKAAMIFSCGAGQVDKYKEELSYLMPGFAVLGARGIKKEVFGGLLAPAAVRLRPDCIAKIQEIAAWLKE